MVSGWPVGDRIFCVRARRCAPVGKVRHSNNSRSVLSRSALLYLHALTIVEVRVQEGGIVHAQSRTCGAQSHKARDVREQILSQFRGGIATLKQVEVHWR